jgi:3-oxoacyl-[acyl-carrier-protein] synthase II
MLEDAALARERGAHVLGEIRGHGSSYDCSRGRDDNDSVQAIASAIRQALHDAFMLPIELDCLSASANGSVAGDRHEVQGACVALNGQAHKLPVTAIKSMLGETLGASAPMQAVSLLETMRDGVLPGIPQLDQIEDDFPLKMARTQSHEEEVINGLINSIGLDGHCCSLILSSGEA